MFSQSPVREEPELPKGRLSRQRVTEIFESERKLRSQRDFRQEEVEVEEEEEKKEKFVDCSDPRCVPTSWGCTCN